MPLAYEYKDDLEIYRNLIKSKSEEKSTDLVPIAGALHASIALAQLLDSTSNNVRMVWSGFNGVISDQQIFLKSLKRCIDRKIQIDIIFLFVPNQNAEAYKLLKKSATKSKIQIKQASDQFKKKLTIGDKMRNFSVFDTDKFHLEKDTNNYLAYCSFNNPELAGKLISIFKKEFNR